MNGLSDRAKESLNAQETGEVWIVLAKIEAEGDPVPLCFVNNTQAVTSNGIEYLPCAFTVNLPEQSSDGGVQPCTVAIDNIDRSIMELVTSSLGKKIYITISVILADTPDTIERGPLKYILRNVRADKNTVRGELHDFYLTDRIVPRLRYTQNLFPGLY